MHGRTEKEVSSNDFPKMITDGPRTFLKFMQPLGEEVVRMLGENPRPHEHP